MKEKKLIRVERFADIDDIQFSCASEFERVIKVVGELEILLEQSTFHDDTKSIIKLTQEARMQLKFLDWLLQDIEGTMESIDNAKEQSLKTEEAIEVSE
jgi:hypothetical protein